MLSRSRLLSGFLVLVCWSGSAAAQPADPSWLIQVSGSIQKSSDNYQNWYSVPPTIPPHVGWESAVNGFRSPGVGLDVACEYRIASRIGLGGAVSLVSTPLEATVHRGTATGIVIADPEPSVLFAPLRVTASYDLLHGSRWRLRAGGQAGVGIYNPTDAVPEFGRARHFEGSYNALFGAHVGMLFTGSKGWGATFGLQYLRSSVEVSELDTGELPQSLTHESFSLIIGVHRAFGRRR
jgi:hypothetical protein